MGTKANLSVTVWDSGRVTVAVEVGEYGKVGYRSANVSLKQTETLDGPALASEWGEDADLARITAGLGRGGVTLLKSVVTVLGKATLTPSKYDREREERWKQEATESEEREKAPATKAAPDGPDNT